MRWARTCQELAQLEWEGMTDTTKSVEQMIEEKSDKVTRGSVVFHERLSMLAG